MFRPTESESSLHSKQVWQTLPLYFFEYTVWSRGHLTVATALLSSKGEREPVSKNPLISLMSKFKLLA